MWASVLANFIFTLFVIFGIFGVVQAKSKYTIAYTISSLYWIFWNIFIMFVYFDVFGFYKFKSILSFRTNSSSWWETSGPGCKVFLSNLTVVEEDPYQPITPGYVTGCVIDFRYVEAFQAGFHALLAIWGFIFGMKVSHAFMSPDDSSESKKKKNIGLPLYSIEYGPHHPEELFDDDESSQSPEESDNRSAMIGGSRPMTPRRVKRRNVNSKTVVTLPQYQQRHDQQPPPYIRRPLSYSSTRSSGRSSTRRQRVSNYNPVSKFLEEQHHHQQQQSSFHQQILNDSSTSNDSGILPFTSSRSQLLNASDLLNNTNTNMCLINPNFASNVSLYRPPSARSSYSNYHGVRTLAFSKQATPQVPTNSYRRNSRSAYSTFLSDGPPAYEIQGAVNSETVI